MKKIVLVLIIAALGLNSNAQTNNPDDLYLSKPFKDAAFKNINVETSHGNIAVSQVSASETRVDVYVRPSSGDRIFSKQEIQKILDEYYAIDISVAGSLLSATAKNKKIFQTGQNSLSISFVIVSAKNAGTHLKTSHGNIELSGFEGVQDVETSHGNLKLENITGKLTARTSHGNIVVSGSKTDIDVSTDHGNIDANDCQGTIKLITSNGNIQLQKQKGKIKSGTSHGNITGDDIQGDLSATTSHGDVGLRALSCSVEARTQHGNIDISVINITGDIIANNSNGNISLKLPEGKGLDIDFRGRSVNVDAVANFTGSKEKDSMKGSLHGGGTKVQAESHSGNVSLRFAH